jgi:transcriptional regulator with XRE-family HTH domain
MGGRAMEPPRLPAGFWSRVDVHEALRGRDFGSLFRLMAKYAGASQTQIAIAVGMTQGQVSNIMGGARRVTVIEVAERALDGLAAPDEARIAFGLAPCGGRDGGAERVPASPMPRSADTGLGALTDQSVDDDVRRRNVLQGDPCRPRRRRRWCVWIHAGYGSSSMCSLRTTSRLRSSSSRTV